MILGASYTQTPLFEAAKKMGLFTVAASIPGDYPGFALADETCYVDISDPQAVVEAAREADVDGVATCGLDLGMAAIGKVCETLNLPGPINNSGFLASNKFEMKKALAAAGVSTARFLCIHNEDELEEGMKKLPFPLILKAVDLMGGRGIYRCDTEEEVRTYYQRVKQETKKEYCLLEEFIQGELFGVEAMVQNGKIMYMLPNNTESFVGNTPTPVGHSVPFRELDVYGEKIEKEVTGAIRALGLDNCPVNCDLLKKDGNVYIIELTGRSGATGLSEIVSRYFGIDYYETILKVALGMDVAPSFEHPGVSPSVLTHTLISDQTGTLKKINMPKTLDAGIFELSFNIEKGDFVRKYTNGRDRIGQIFIEGQSLDECEHILKKTLSQITLNLEGETC